MGETHTHRHVHLSVYKIDWVCSIQEIQNAAGDQGGLILAGETRGFIAKEVTYKFGTEDVTYKFGTEGGVEF